MKKKKIILTALKHNLKKYSNIIFLGEWCLTYNNRKSFKKKKTKTLKHHWTSLQQLKKDHKFLEKEYENLLEYLSKNLNRYHSSNHTKEYWRIIIGPWLYFYIVSMFDRWKSVDPILKKINNHDIPRFNCDLKILDTYDTVSFWKKASQSDIWNQVNFQRIITYRSEKKINFISGLVETNHFKKRLLKKKEKLNLKFFVRKIFNFIDALLSKFSIKTHKIYIETEYFSKFDMLKLFFKCKIIPSFNISTFKYETKNSSIVTNKEERSKIFENENPFNKNFLNFLKACIIQDLPVIFLEDFKKTDSLNKQFNNLKLKSIFSSISQIFNERYKLWLAKMIGNGASHYIMAHGGALPLIYNSNMFEHELKISKKYFSWHNPIHKKQIKVTPLQLLKVRRESVNNKSINNEKNKCLILSCDTLRYPVKIQGWPYVEQHKLCVNDISTMIDNFNSNIKKNIIYRCSATSDGFNTDKILKGKYKFLDTSNIYDETFNDTLLNTRIAICTYPETAITECLVHDIPMIISMSPKLYHFAPQIKKILDELENKIFFSNPKNASKFINSIWKNPDEWWQDVNTKKSVNKLKKFIYEIEDDWMNDWKKLIKKN